MPAKSTTVDEYLAALPDDQRAALEKLRKAIRAAAPKAEECISYQLAAFRLDGRLLVSFGATSKHCAFYPMSSSTVEAHKDELKGYQTSKGTIRFEAKSPLPTTLVRKLVKARIAENNGNDVAAKPTRVLSKKRVITQSAGNSQEDPAVVAFLAELDHPLKSAIESVRSMILRASSEIREGIKWNSPSFRTTEYFATFNLRSKDKIQLVFHTGAKVRDTAVTGLKIADPAGLIKWLAKDRCLVTLGTENEIPSKRKAFEVLVREWIKQV